MDIHRLTAKELSITLIFTAFVCVATCVLKVDIPQTRGYFNIGDTMVYTTALLFGPYIGGIAGGAGSALADIILAAPWYAPGTLVIKAIEGFLVGYISQRANPIEKWRRLWRIVTIAVGVALAFILYEVGTLYYNFEWQFTPLGHYLGSFRIDPAFWMVVALLLEAFIIYAGVGLDPRVTWYGLAIVIGGTEMILGYLIYEFYPLGYAYGAFAEIPYNIGQLIVGLALAIPIVRAIRKVIPLPGFSGIQQ